MWLLSAGGDEVVRAFVGGDIFEDDFGAIGHGVEVAFDGFA